ncbi:acyl transferase [Chondrinema litorale]|uniref:acyl transferase n=1 Tax=Chondrinema litorale TaxID=2994555 RepID=UPI002543A6C5|nr:acyl transferase [Chondrinema litorale]UZR95129.1 acyl transferase [Chondrinema litorale]
MVEKLKEEVLKDKNEQEFKELCLEIFYFQAKENPVYKEYLEALKVKPKEINRIENIPFLPISFFKTSNVICKHANPVITFESSGTTGMQTSRHFVSDPDFYKVASEKIFNSFYGSLKDFSIYALLPSYLERSNSSLIFMVQHFIENAQSDSGFFLHNIEKLVEQLAEAKVKNKKIILLGVTFALLDLAEKYEIDLSSVIVMETGGMKGRRKEMIREEIHEILKRKLNISEVHSEYGMTELLSQFYSKGNGVFSGPDWAGILIRDVSDPFSVDTIRQNGTINVIDLANIDSCCFIETNDIGNFTTEGKKEFEVRGRLDKSDIRGCNLLIT